ncbi:tyrosine-protein phosphatase [Caenimonas sedimenti]|uniref:Tyrosine-protein phosphatase n=1 Tax=Caenimonas sedimenti TaxID=2596921 RepID=A0A562ZIL4_9BURK|nr:tyrosine-protein phosphatase [Caenimonas sedimenti]TWO68430.1 tyrosine-protein phosphatase [Caenimonas sedimenti]
MQLTGSTNFRPVSGLRPRTLYRSDHLGALNADDARQIQALGIQRVLDFRGVDERESAVCALPDVTVHSLPIEPTVVQALNSLVAAGQTLTKEVVAHHMRETYRGFVRENTHRFAEFFGHLLESGEPTVFHCTAGKDRTGFAAALVLHALGAPDDEVMHDYLLTNERLAMPSVSRYGLPGEVMAVLWRVQPDFLQAAFDEAAAAHGSVDGYLREALGVGDPQREHLRGLYLA